MHFHLTIQDPNEGLSWSGSNIKLYESPNDLTTNSAGNLQVVHGSTRRLTVDSSGIEVVGEIHINNGNTTLSEGSSDTVRITTDDGYVDIGPMNTTWSHFQTDRGKFYFNKEIRAETRIGVYNQNTYLESNDLYLDGQIYHIWRYQHLHAIPRSRSVAC